MTSPETSQPQAVEIHFTTDAVAYLNDFTADLRQYTYHPDINPAEQNDLISRISRNRAEGVMSRTGRTLRA